MIVAKRYLVLNGTAMSFVADCEVQSGPNILYWGNRLANTEPETLKRLSTRQHAPGSADRDAMPSLFGEVGSALIAPPGFSGHRGGKSWAQRFVTRRVEAGSARAFKIVCEDKSAGIEITLAIELYPENDILAFTTTVSNLAKTSFSIETCAAARLPLDPRANVLRGFTGRWANEFQLETVPVFTGSYVRENRRGRTSHDAFPGLLAGTAETTEQSGLCFGFHLGWSGNSRLEVNRLFDGRSFVQLGELLLPGEIRLPPQGSYRSPTLFASYSKEGYSALSQQFQRHVRTKILNQRLRTKPRPIHYNTWEAVYFDHDQDKLFELASRAAGLGVERFILDDGWFSGRRNDKTGLGDWWISPEIYPDGLGPLIQHVRNLGMDFGLWFEPEMVNPDSDLFRKHPDWVLSADGLEHVSFRNQLALDLTRTDVSDYLFGSLDRMLSDNDISYIKWDMNRDIHHPGSGGKAVMHEQVWALYKLIDRVRESHPEVEIESCASGGARVDYGVLSRTDRVWTSDSNDALDRQRIQRGASHFFPPEVLGAHVGPERCHITGRRLDMELRVATAFFGHMGLELNLMEESAEDLEILKNGLSLHKTHRTLIHSGDFYRLDTPSHVNAIGVVSQDKTRALFSWCNMTGHKQTHPGRLYCVGLDEAKTYRIELIWPSPIRSISEPSIVQAIELQTGGIPLPAQALTVAGVQMPLMQPETCLIFMLSTE